MNNYRIVVDHFNDFPHDDLIEPMAECKTLKAAKEELRQIYAAKHFACHKDYYIQRRINGVWEYVGKGPTLEHRVKVVKDGHGKEIKLPIEVVLSRSDIRGNVKALFKVIQTLVDNWPGAHK